MFRMWIQGCASVLLAVMVLVLLGEPAHSQAAKTKKRALLVGVTKYNDARLTKLAYTENDVTKLAAELKECGFEVTLLTNTLGAKDEAKMPTAANIRKELEKSLKGLGNKDTFLLALAGHGLCFAVEDMGKKRDESFFCPFDARPRSGTTLAKNSETMLGYTELLKELDESGCGAKLLLVDACRDTPAGGFRSAAVTMLPALPRGTAALFSCKAGEKSFEDARYAGGHGLFFHHVIQGIKGEAKDPKTGRVTWGRLASYVTEQVQEGAEAVGDGFQQTPELRSEMTGTLTLRTGLTVVKGGEEKVEKVGKGKEKEEKIEKVGKLEYLTIELGAKKVQMKLVKIPAGEFMMGADKDVDADAYDGEKPRHKVKITKAFWLGVLEVTQAQYEAIMGENPSHFCATGGGKDQVAGVATDEFPVEQVSWDDAKKFLEKLSEQASEKKAGRKYRLTTEAEWEYACRGSVLCEDKYKKFHFGDTLSSKQANFNDDLKRTCKVGSYEANAFGLFDMHGNVYEWCEDGKREYAANSESDPSGPLLGAERVFRGGSWYDFAWSCRSAFRLNRDPSNRLNSIGFRVALRSSE
jgi:formylglycine-generating enzyme required for sulfatase activity